MAMKLLLACALVACAAASSLRKDDHYAPKYEGFDGNKFGTITLFANGAEKVRFATERCPPPHSPPVQHAAAPCPESVTRCP